MTARATARASASSAAPLTWQVISVVAPSPSAACWRARSPGDRLDRAAQRGRAGLAGVHRGCARRPDASQEHGVVGARVAVDRELVPGPRRPRREEPVERGRDRGRVGEDDGEHRRHARVDHPDALGDPGDGDGHGRRRPRPAARGGRVAIFVVESVVRSATRRGREGLVGGGELAGRHAAIVAGDLVHRQPRADDARREVEDRGPGCPARSRRASADRRLVGVAGRARRRVRRARGRDDGRANRRPRRPCRRSPGGWPATSRTGAAAKRFGVNTAGRGAGAAGPPRRARSPGARTP